MNPQIIINIKSMGVNGKKDAGGMEFTTNEVIDEDTSELIPGNEVTVYDSDGNINNL